MSVVKQVSIGIAAAVGIAVVGWLWSVRREYDGCPDCKKEAEKGRVS